MKAIQSIPELFVFYIRLRSIQLFLGNQARVQLGSLLLRWAQ